MSVNNRALSLADELENEFDEVTLINSASVIRYLVSFNQQLMDEVARIQKREWVGLTEAEVTRCWSMTPMGNPNNRFGFYLALEAKLKEKNT